MLPHLGETFKVFEDLKIVVHFVVNGRYTDSPTSTAPMSQCEPIGRWKPRYMKTGATQLRATFTVLTERCARCECAERRADDDAAHNHDGSERL